MNFIFASFIAHFQFLKRIVLSTYNLLSPHKLAFATRATPSFQISCFSSLPGQINANEVIYFMKSRYVIN